MQNTGSKALACVRDTRFIHICAGTRLAAATPATAADSALVALPQLLQPRERGALHGGVPSGARRPAARAQARPRTACGAADRAHHKVSAPLRAPLRPPRPPARAREPTGRKGPEGNPGRRGADARCVALPCCFAVCGTGRFVSRMVDKIYQKGGHKPKRLQAMLVQHPPLHPNTATHTRTHIHTHARIYTRTHTHARTNTHAHTRTHSYFGAHTDPRRLSLSGHSQRCAAVRLHRCGAMFSSGRAVPRAAGADGVLRADRCDTPRIPSAQEKVPSPSVVPEVHKFAHVSIADLKPGKNNVAVAVVVSGHASPVDPTDPS